MKHFSIAGLALAVALTSASARAERPFTARHPQVGVRVGYGLYVGEDDIGDFNPYGLGVGLTTGYTFDHLYIGISGEYYLGGWTEGLSDQSSGSIWSGMAEPGYDIILGKMMMLRPQVGVGVSSLRFKGCGVVEDAEGNLVQACGKAETEYKLAVAPGAMFFIDDLGGFYGQVGARYHHVFFDEAGVSNVAGVLLNVGVGAAW